MYNKSLSIFPNNYKEIVVRYIQTLPLLFEKYDVAIFMARKAICFYQALRITGLVQKPTCCDVYSSRILNYNIYDKLKGKKVVLIEDVMIRGLSVKKANEYLNEQAIECDTYILARTYNDKKNICEGLNVIGTEIEFYKEDIHRFSKHIADFIEASMCPYNIDQPIYVISDNDNIKANYFIHRFRLFDLSSDLQEYSGISSFLINFSDCFCADDIVSSFVDMCKIRIMHNTKTGLLIAIPFVLLDELPTSVLNSTFQHFANNKIKALIENKNNFIYLENKLKIIHYILSALLMDAFIEYAGLNDIRRLDEKDNYVFSCNILNSIENKQNPIHISGIGINSEIPYNYEFINNEYMSITFDYLYSDYVYYNDYFSSCNCRITTEIIILEDLKAVIKELTGREINEYIFSHIIDVLIDKGYIIPSVIHKISGSVIRAYKCGEVYALNEEHYNLFSYGLLHYLQFIKHDYLRKMEFEKLCVLFFRNLVNNNLLPMYGLDSPDGYTICYSKFGPRVSTTKPIYSADENSTLANKLLKISKIRIENTGSVVYKINTDAINIIENTDWKRIADNFFERAGLVYRVIFEQNSDKEDLFDKNRNMYIRTYIEYLTLMAIGDRKKDQLLSLLAEIYLFDQINLNQDLMGILFDCRKILDGLISGMWKYMCFSQETHPIEFLYNSLKESPDYSSISLSLDIEQSFISNPNRDINKHIEPLIKEAGLLIYSIGYYIWFLLKKYNLSDRCDNFEQKDKREYYYKDMIDIRNSQKDFVDGTNDAGKFIEYFRGFWHDSGYSCRLN